MASGGVGSWHPSEHGPEWPTTVASLMVGAWFFALWFWLLPSWLGFQAEAVRNAPWRWIAAVPSALGFAVALRVGLREDWTWNASANGSPEEVGRGGVLPLCA